MKQPTPAPPVPAPTPAQSPPTMPPPTANPPPIPAVKKQPPARSKAPADPFKTFTKTTVLPPIENTTESKIDDLVISKRFLLGAELLSYEGVGRGKILFEMARDPQDKQRWIVTVARNPRDKKTQIAAFRKTDTELLFQWLPEAAKNRNAGYLQNCMVKLILPDRSTWLKLRHPIELETMRLTNESLVSSMEASLPFLPNPDLMVIEILPTDIPNSTFSPAQIDFQRRLPGRIAKTEEKEAKPFVWIRVAADLRQRLKVQTDLVLFARNQVQPIKNLSELSALASTLKQHETELFAQHEIAKNTKAPPGQADHANRICAKMEKAAEDARIITARGIAYVEWAPKILNQPIGIRVFVRTQGYEIEIAKTKPPSP